MVQTDGFTDFRGLQEKPGQKGEKKTRPVPTKTRKKEEGRIRRNRSWAKQRESRAN
jgi:hypothetical protein